MSQLFSKANRQVFATPLGLNHPVLVQVLGICSALAVTAKLEPAIVMGLSVTIITSFSNVIISLLRRPSPCASASSCSWLSWPLWSLS